MNDSNLVSLVIGGFLFTSIIFIVVLYVVFTAWMFIHSIIRTIKMWPEENALNLVMVLLIIVLEVIGAIVYYFDCYKKTSVLARAR